MDSLIRTPSLLLVQEGKSNEKEEQQKKLKRKLMCLILNPFERGQCVTPYLIIRPF